MRVWQNDVFLYLDDFSRPEIAAIATLSREHAKGVNTDTAGLKIGQYDKPNLACVASVSMRFGAK